MNLHKCILTNNDCYKSGRTIVPIGIMVHSTGANNPTLKRYVAPDDGTLGKNAYGNDWNRPGTGVCVHAFIGKTLDGSIATYQTLPWNHRAWHCGSKANNTHISFEICEDDLSDREYFNAVYQEAVELCVYLCKMFDFTEKDIICHSEGAKMGIASGHKDVMHWFPLHGKSMDTLRADVAALLPAKPAEPEEEEESDMGYTTEDFVRDVQNIEGVRIDGDAGSDTLLHTVTISRYYNRNHMLVLPIQKRLKSMGFDPDGLDGTAGPGFDAAAKALQRSIGFSNPDGEITKGGKSWRKLLGMEV